MRKVILVPPYGTMYFAPELQVVDKDMRYRPTNMIAINVVPPAQRDPMIDYAALYCREHPTTGTVPTHNMVTLSTQEAAHKVWDLRTIVDWLEENATDVVLVQALTDMQQWRFLFTAGVADREHFADWYREQRIHTMAVPRRDETAVREWISQNVRRQHRLVNTGDNVLVSVRDPNEEVHFKLRWIGRKEESSEA